MIRDLLAMEAYFDENRILTIYIAKAAIFKTAPQSFKLMSENGKMNNIKIISVEEKSDLYVYKTKIPYNVAFDFSLNYFIIGDSGLKSPLFVGDFTKTQKFEENYFYDKNDLGASIVNDKTHFKIWAPTASQMQVMYRPSHTLDFKYKNLTKSKQGLWSVTINKRLTKYEYLFFINMNNIWQQFRDPYAHASTPNGLVSVVYDPQAFKAEDKLLSARHKIPKFQDAIIYRLSIRDFTSNASSGVKKEWRGKYLGLTQRDSKNRDREITSLDYIKNMGFSHIQLLPVYDFATVDEIRPYNNIYTYGYYPDQLMIPEGSYATDVKDPYQRIRELKTLISTIHKENIGVIMDLSFKRLFNIKLSGFEYSVPGYYFHKVANKYIFNYKLKMVQKVIIDTFIWWLKTYQVDGFRLSDSKDIAPNIINNIHRELLKINKNIIFMVDSVQKSNSSEISKAFPAALFGMAVTKGEHIKGYLTGNIGERDNFILGLTGLLVHNDPKNNINFLETLHTRTLSDTLTSFEQNISQSKLQKIILLANVCVLIAQGIPLFVQGQEFYRSKKMLFSTEFMNSNISEIDWNKLNEHHLDLKVIKDLICLRKHKLPELRMMTKNEIRKKVKYEVTHNGLIKIFYDNINRPKENRPLIIFINNSGKRILINFKKENEVIFDTIKGVWKSKKRIKEIYISPYQMIILRENVIKVKTITRQELINKRIFNNIKQFS